METPPTNANPIVLFGLMSHETKMTVVHAVLIRPSGSEGPALRSKKDPLSLSCGFRRFSVRPIYSEHSTGKKHRLLRFFRAGDTAVASFLAPVLFGPAPVLAFQTGMDGSPQLVAAGPLLSCDPDRIVLKRALLSGHPFRIMTRGAVVRFMFFNQEDIRWFKPVELRTKYGRRGRIEEPIGTHGHMKCRFDGQLKSMDTVLMPLYKRIFPKWSYEPNLPLDESPVR